MLPLPYSVEHAVAGPLQRVATVCSTYVMQTIGLPAVSEGNVIILPSGRIEVERACSGLSMLLIFFAPGGLAGRRSGRPDAARRGSTRGPRDGRFAALDSAP